MTYFGNLSIISQDLIMLNIEFQAKKLLLGLALIFSIYFIFIYWKQKKETPFLLLGLGRLVLWLCSLAYICTFPLMIFFLYPQVGLDTLLMFMLIFYTIAATITSFIVMLNIFYYGIGIIVSFAGVKTDKKVDKVFKSIIVEMISLMGFKWKKKDSIQDDILTKVGIK